MMESTQIIANMEELAERYRTLAKRNDEKWQSNASGDRAMLHMGKADAYEHSAEMLECAIELARTMW